MSQRSCTRFIVRLDCVDLAADSLVSVICCVNFGCKYVIHFLKGQGLMRSIFLIQAAISALLFLLFAWMAKKTPRGVRSASGGTCEFEVFQRNKKIKAIYKEKPFRFWAGFLYASGFFFLSPVLIWRYGAAKTVFLIATPLVCGAALPLAGTILEFSVDSNPFFGMFIAVILRGCLGVFLAKRDAMYWRDTLLRRGWKSVGYEVAKSRKAAIVQFAGQPKPALSIRRRASAFASDLCCKIKGA